MIRHAWFELNVDTPDVTVEPLIDVLHEMLRVADVESSRRIAIAEPCQRFGEPGVCRAVLLGHWALITVHTLFLGTEVPFGVPVQ